MALARLQPPSAKPGEAVGDFLEERARISIAALQTKIKQCFYDYKVPAEMAKGLGGDRFLPITYKKDWELVRTVAASAGELFTREAFDKAASGKK